MMLNTSDFVADWSNSPFCQFNAPAWQATTLASELISKAIKSLSNEYFIDDSIAIHRSAVVEPSAIIKGPAIIGPNSFIGAGALIRGGAYMDRDCVVGHACELKSSFMFANSSVAHFNFIGDSVIGARVNIEAGAVIANYRNELHSKRIRVLWNDKLIDTGVEKFGALIGDDVKIGANAVVAPGTVIIPGTVLPRLANIDHLPGKLSDKHR